MTFTHIVKFMTILILSMF